MQPGMTVVLFDVHGSNHIRQCTVYVMLARDHR